MGRIDGAMLCSKPSSNAQHDWLCGQLTKHWHSRPDIGGRTCCRMIQQVEVDDKAGWPEAQIQIEQRRPAVHGLSSCPQELSGHKRFDRVLCYTSCRLATLEASKQETDDICVACRRSPCTMLGQGLGFAKHRGTLKGSGSHCLRLPHENVERGVHCSQCVTSTMHAWCMVHAALPGPAMFQGSFVAML